MLRWALLGYSKGISRHGGVEADVKKRTNLVVITLISLSSCGLRIGSVMWWLRNRMTDTLGRCGGEVPALRQVQVELKRVEMPAHRQPHPHPLQLTLTCRYSSTHSIPISSSSNSALDQEDSTHHGISPI